MHPVGRPVVALLSACVVTTCAVGARADQPAYFDGEAAMTGGSNTAIVRGAGAGWYNPAGLHDGTLNWFDLTASAFVLRARDFSGVFQVRFPSGPQTVEAGAIDVQSIPSGLVYSRRLTSSLTGALGIFVSQQQAYSVAGDFARTEQFAGHPTPISLVGRAGLSLLRSTYKIGPSFSWEVTRRVRLGASAYVVYGSLQQTSLQQVSITDGPASAVAAANAEQQLTSFGGQLVLAAQLEPVDGLHLGLVLRSPVISFSQSGTDRREITSFSSGGGSFDGPDYQVSQTPPIPDAAGRLLEPARATLAFAWRGKRFWVGVEGDVSMPLRSEDLGIVESLNFDARAGTRIWVTDLHSIGFGLFTDRSTAGLGGSAGDHVVDYYGGTAGFNWDWRYALKEGKAQRTLVFSSSIAARYAAGVARVAGLLYAPKDASYAELNHLQPIDSQSVFHAFTLQLGGAMRW